MTARLAKLALEDGTVYSGRAFGASGEKFGEVVFNTSMTGYQEVLTDPSYAGQIVTMTCAEIGNYGVSPADVESRAPQVAGFVIRDESPLASNWRAEGTLRTYLSANRIVAISDIDTRALTRLLLFRNPKAVCSFAPGRRERGCRLTARTTAPRRRRCASWRAGRIA